MIIICNKKTGDHPVFLCYERACKPGSVMDSHQSRPAVAGRLKPPPENGRAGLVFSHGVAPDRVYSGHVSPRAGCALTAPFHHLLAEIALPRAPLRSPSGADFARRSPTRPACAGLVWGTPGLRGSLFLLHLSEGRPWWVLPVILALWSPDFPHARAFARCPRLSGPLTPLIVNQFFGDVKQNYRVCKLLDIGV